MAKTTKPASAATKTEFDPTKPLTDAQFGKLTEKQQKLWLDAAEEREKAELKAQDAAEQKKGMTHRVTMWVHAGGDDKCLDMYMNAVPTDKEIAAKLKARRSRVLDDYTVTVLRTGKVSTSAEWKAKDEPAPQPAPTKAKRATKAELAARAAQANKDLGTPAPSKEETKALPSASENYEGIAALFRTMVDAAGKEGRVLRWIEFHDAVAAKYTVHDWRGEVRKIVDAIVVEGSRARCAIWEPKEAYCTPAMFIANAGIAGYADPKAPSTGTVVKNPEASGKAPAEPAQAYRTQMVLNHILGRDDEVEALTALVASNAFLPTEYQLNAKALQLRLPKAEHERKLAAIKAGAEAKAAAKKAGRGSKVSSGTGKSAAEKGAEKPTPKATPAPAGSTTVEGVTLSPMLVNALKHYAAQKQPCEMLGGKEGSVATMHLGMKKLITKDADKRVTLTDLGKKVAKALA